MAKDKCVICKRDYKAAASLMKHYYVKHGAKYMCKFCTAQFCKKAALMDHTLKVHIGKAYFACRLCSLRSSQKKILQEHYESHREQMGDLYCLPCDAWFANHGLMRIHLRYMHCRVFPKGSTGRLSPISAFKCQFCLQNFGSRYEHCSHSIQEHGAYMFCSYCEEQFLSQAEVLQHRVYYHKRKRSYACVYCWVNFCSDKSLKTHQKATHNILRCPRCHCLAPSVDCLAMHRQYEDTKASRAAEPRIPRETEPTISAPRNAYMLLCLFCFVRVPAESFNEHAEDHLLERQPLSCNEHFEFLFDSDSIKRHVTCFRTEASRGLTMKQDPDAPSINVTCEQCGFKAKDDNHLSRHKAWCHNIKSCRQCSQEMIGRNGTKLHEAEHGIPFWPDEMRRSDQSKSAQSIPPPHSESPASFTIRGEAESSGQFPLKGTKRKFQPDISSPSSISHTKNESPVTKKFEKSPKSDHSNAKNVYSMAEDPNKIIGDKKTPFFEAVTQIKEEVLSDDSVSVEKEEIRPPRAEFSENSSTTPKPKKRIRVSTSFNETPGYSNSTKIHANNSNCNENSESDSGSLDADTDSSDDEPTFTHSRSAKVIPVTTALNSNNSVKKTKKSFPIIPPASENVQQTPSSNSVLKEARYICKLCSQYSLYKKSVKRHLEIIHRIPLPNVVEFMELKEVEITLEGTKKRVKTNTVECQCQFDCPECAKKDKEIKKLKSSLKKIKNATSQIEECLV